MFLINERLKKNKKNEVNIENYSTILHKLKNKIISKEANENVLNNNFFEKKASKKNKVFEKYLFIKYLKK